MTDFVLHRLETLQTALAGLDPAGEVNVADHAAAMAAALRDVLGAADRRARRSSNRDPRELLRALAR